MRATAPSPPTASTPAVGRLRRFWVLHLARVAGRSPSIPRGNTFISEPLRGSRVTTSTSPPAGLVWDLGPLEYREFSGSPLWDDPDHKIRLIRRAFAPLRISSAGSASLTPIKQLKVDSDPRLQPSKLLLSPIPRPAPIFLIFCAAKEWNGCTLRHFRSQEGGLLFPDIDHPGASPCCDPGRSWTT